MVYKLSEMPITLLSIRFDEIRAGDEIIIDNLHQMATAHYPMYSQTHERLLIHAEKIGCEVLQIHNRDDIRLKFKPTTLNQ